MLKIWKMNYSSLISVITIELGDIPEVDKKYIAYSEARHGFGNVFPQIYLSSNERIIVLSK